MADQNDTVTINKNNLLIGGLVILGAFSFYLWNKVQSLEKNKTATNAQVAGQQAPQQAPQAPTELKIAKPNASEDHWRGDKKARFVMVEYSDYECPFCASFRPTAQRVLDENKGKVALVYRNFPLSFHPKAQKSAEAAECAADLGGNDTYWKMHDKIFDAMPSMELSQLPGLATQIGLNKAAFQKCLDGGKFEKKVKDDLSEGSSAGVAATPTTVIYDMQTGKQKVVEGALPYEQVKTMLDELMKG